MIRNASSDFNGVNNMVTEASSAKQQTLANSQGVVPSLETLMSLHESIAKQTARLREKLAALQ